MTSVSFYGLFPASLSCAGMTITYVASNVADEETTQSIRCLIAKKNSVEHEYGGSSTT
jgi:hypothetical protein